MKLSEREKKKKEKDLKEGRREGWGEKEIEGGGKNSQTFERGPSIFCRKSQGARQKRPIL